MVIGQTPVPATPINVNIFFVLKKSLLFCNLQFTPAKHQNLEQQNFWQLAIKQNRFFFLCVCVAKYNNCGSTHFPIPLVLYTAGHCVYSTKMEHFFTLSGLTNLRPNPSFQTFFQELSLTDDCDGRLPTIWFFETSDFERLKNTVRFRRCTQFKGRSQGYVEKSQHYCEATESALKNLKKVV